MISGGLSPPLFILSLPSDLYMSALAVLTASQPKSTESSMSDLLLPLNPSPELGSPRDLVTSDVTDTSFAVSWTAAPGNVRQYRVKYKSLFTTESGEAVIPGSSTTTVLQGLTPETRYEVSVFAVYGHGTGQPLVGEETTDGKLLFFFLGLFRFLCPHFISFL